MKYELKIIHNSILSKELSELFEAGDIDGYTTLPIHKSCGRNNGVFKQDIVSGEKFLTYIWFGEENIERARQLKEEIKRRNYFVVLSKLQ